MQSLRILLAHGPSQKSGDDEASRHRVNPMCVHLIKTTANLSLARLTPAEKNSFDTESRETDNYAGQSRLWLFMFNYQRMIISEFKAPTVRLG